jgi:hypothetical protein
MQRDAAIEERKQLKWKEKANSLWAFVVIVVWVLPEELYSDNRLLDLAL